MKDFLKMTLAAIVGFVIVNIITFFFLSVFIGAIAAIGSTQPVMPRSAILKIDMSTISLAEQTGADNPISTLQGNKTTVVGILDATRAVRMAAEDPAIQFIYLKPDMTAGGMAEIEELRNALVEFRESGKPVISYIETPTNGGYYLASASDKIYMTPHSGGINLLTGISSQMIFLKDILDKLGVNIQLIRHGKFKSAGEMFIKSEASPESRLQNEELIKSVWKSWSEEIALGRNISEEEFNACIDNLELVLPEDFVENKLADGLLTREELKTKLAEYASVSGGFDNASMITLQDYATLKVQPNFKADKKVAVIFATGNIVDGVDYTQVDGDRFAQIISEVRKDESVKSVVFRVNSPGGSVLASEKIKNEISLLAAEKPVVASFGDYAASGGYWISAGCDHIFTNSSTLTGSIGVFSSIIPDFSKTLDNIANINITSVGSNRHSDIYSGLRPLSDKELQYMQGSVDDIYDKFTSLVAEGRELEKEYVDSIAQGRVWSGRDALRLDLADSKGTILDALEYAASLGNGNGAPADLSQWDIVEYPKPLTTLETIMLAFGNSSASVFKNTPFSGVERAFKDINATKAGKTYARLPYELIIQ